MELQESTVKVEADFIDRISDYSTGGALLLRNYLNTDTFHLK